MPLYAGFITLVAVLEGATGSGAAALPAAPDAGAQSSSPEAEAGDLLKQWEAAQNDGRFEDYARLYAPQFNGLRRSGERTVELDRKGWMADRKRMFGKRMEVRATGVQIQRSGADRVELRFEQSFSCGKYQDRGAKRLVLRRARGGGDGWLIEREEMLSSRRERNDGWPALELPLIVNGCPGEYCTCVSSDRLQAPVELHASMSADSPIVARLKKGTRVENVVFKNVINSPGKARLDTPGRPRVWSLGYAAEGACLIHDGESLGTVSCDEVVEESGSYDASGGLGNSEWVEITYSKGKIGYAADDQAIRHGYVHGPGRGIGCVFGF